MPRRHNPKKHTPFRFANNDAGKTRYPSRDAAKKAAEMAMLQKIGLELGVYQGLDGGWYLTSKPAS